MGSARNVGRPAMFCKGLSCGGAGTRRKPWGGNFCGNSPSHLSPNTLTAKLPTGPLRPRMSRRSVLVEKAIAVTETRRLVTATPSHLPRCHDDGVFLACKCGCLAFLVVVASLPTIAVLVCYVVCVACCFVWLLGSAVWRACHCVEADL